MSFPCRSFVIFLIYAFSRRFSIVRHYDVRQTRGGVWENRRVERGLRVPSRAGVGGCGGDLA